MKWTEYHADSNPKAQKSTPKGALDARQAVGKDEVGSSNLPSSSRKALKTLSFQGFFICLDFHYSQQAKFGKVLGRKAFPITFL